MDNQIPDLGKALLLRADKKNNKLLVWFGGEYIKIYSLHEKEELEKKIVVDPWHNGWVSITAAKQTMKDIMQRGQYGTNR